MRHCYCNMVVYNHATIIDHNDGSEIYYAVYVKVLREPINFLLRTQVTNNL